MTRSSDKIECRTPTPGKQPTRIDRWKFERIRQAILDAIGDYPDGLLFGELPAEVKRRVPQDEREKIGSIMWYVTTVKLELEVRGELRRAAGKGPQRLQLTPPL